MCKCVNFSACRYVANRQIPDRIFWSVFRLDALAKALSVIATATWLGGWVAGWLGGWLSHSGIVSKRQNVSENFFDHLKAPNAIILVF